MRIRVVSGVAAALAVAFVASTASAAPVGTLTTNACADGGVTVTFTTIDWLGGAVPGAGCITTGVPTAVNFVVGGGGLSTLPAGQTGVIRDLTGVLPVPNFMTFPAYPDLAFDLFGVGPGVANTACSNVLNPSAAPCSAVANSPFVLRSTTRGTSVTLDAFGIARDATGQSPWSGLFSVDFAGETPLQVQNRFLATGSITSGHTGSFIVAPVPEPASMLLLGTGLLGASLLRRRGVKK